VLEKQMKKADDKIQLVKREKQKVLLEEKRAKLE